MEWDFNEKFTGCILSRNSPFDPFLLNDGL